MSAEERIQKILSDLKREDEEKQKLQDASVIKQTAKRWFSLTRFWYQFLASVIVIYRKIIWPIYSWGYWLFSILFWQHFRKVWDWFVYRTNEAGERKFSKIKGAVLIGLTTAFLFVMYQAMFVAVEVGLYAFTARVNETVYLSNAQEISAEDNLHSAQGCIAPEDGKEFSCSAEDSLYFRIEPSFFNHAWSVWNTGSLFLPDYVAAPIAPGWQVCTVTSYGFRAKLFMRTWDIYPHLLSANCKEIPS